MTSLYNLQPSAFRLGLIGYPLSHSLSPRIHNAALRALGLEGEYCLYPVLPHSLLTSHLGRGAGGEGLYFLENLLETMRADQLHGLNVTIPHKQAVMQHLDALTPAAQAIGAVNTIFRQGDQLIGDNTDAPGFWDDIVRRLDVSTSRPLDALILGAGGSARAVVYALLSQGYRVTIAARRLEQANALATHFAGKFPNLQLETFNLQSKVLRDRPFDIIVNTTPLGMSPNTEASPWPVETPFPENAAIYDLVYNPNETLLVRQARAAGLKAVTGFGMLIEQAALAFERWTGLEAPRTLMHKALDEPTK
jgi:shikimate dehydrogenase